jgi:hypothetical protein
VPLSSLSLAGVSDDNAGVASAVLNSTQQIGGSLGTSLLNTFYASAVTSYVVSHHLNPAQFNPAAAIHGYHVAFWIGVGLMSGAFLAVLVLVNARKEDFSAQPAAPVGA